MNNMQPKLGMDIVDMNRLAKDAAAAYRAWCSAPEGKERQKAKAEYMRLDCLEGFYGEYNCIDEDLPG